MNKPEKPQTPVRIGNEWIMRAEGGEVWNLYIDSYREPLSEDDWQDFEPATFVAFSAEQILAEAQSPEMRQRIVDALQTWEIKMSSGLVEFSEQVFHLPAQGLDVRIAVLLPLLLYFAIEQKTQKVFIKSMKWIGDGSNRIIENPKPCPKNVDERNGVVPRSHYNLRFSSRAVHVIDALVAKMLDPAHRNGRPEEQIIEMALEDYAKRQGIVVEK